MGQRYSSEQFLLDGMAVSPPSRCSIKKSVERAGHAWHGWRLLIAALLVLPLYSRSASADVIYGYPVRAYRPYAVYRDPYPTSGAALGPWPWTFDVGGGPTTVLNSPQKSYSSGANFTFGGGYNFSPRAGLLFEYSSSWLGVNESAIARNQAIDGDDYLWSFTVNPIWRFRIAGPVGGYLIGGGGFYENVTHYDVPFTIDFGHGNFISGISRTTSVDDTGGVNAGAGLTCNVGWGTKLYVEARYHYVFTSGHATEIIPVTIGFRW